MDANDHEVADIRTRLLFEMAVDLHPALSFGAGPNGIRILYGSAGGAFQGPSLHGTVLPLGGDWALFRADGTMEVDVRLSWSNFFGHLDKGL